MKRYMKIIAALLPLCGLLLAAPACTEDATQSGVADRLFRPVNVTPVANMNALSVTWAPIPGAASYCLELWVRDVVTGPDGTKHDDKQLLLTEESIPVCEWSVEGLAYSTQYWVRLRANHLDVNMNSYFTDFVGVRTADETQVLVCTIDDVTTGDVTFSWMKGYGLEWLRVFSSDGSLFLEHAISDDDGPRAFSTRLPAGRYTAFVGNAEKHFNVVPVLIPVLYEVAPADISYDGVTLRWAPDASLEKLALTDTATGTVREIAVDGTAGEYAFPASELAFYTKYSALLVYSDGAVTNSVEFTTKDRMPDDMITVSTGEELRQALLTASSGQVIALNPGEYTGLYDMAEGAAEPSGIVLTRSVKLIAATAESPVVKLGYSFSINAPAEIGSIEFDGITFEAVLSESGSLNPYLINVQSSHVFTLDRFVAVNCRFEGFCRSIFRTQRNDNDASAVQRVRSVEIDNCIVRSGNDTSNYAFIHLSSKKPENLVSEISIRNSTFTTTPAVIRLVDVPSKSGWSDAVSATLASCTFYDLGAGSPATYLADLTSDAELPNGKVTMLDCVVSKCPMGQYRGVRASNFTADNSYRSGGDTSFNGSASNKNIVEIEGATALTFFADPGNGDFTLRDATLLSGKVGDPRWIPAL